MKSIQPLTKFDEIVMSLAFDFEIFQALVQQVFIVLVF